MYIKNIKIEIEIEILSLILYLILVYVTMTNINDNDDDDDDYIISIFKDIIEDVILYKDRNFCILSLLKVVLLKGSSLEIEDILKNCKDYNLNFEEICEVFEIILEILGKIKDVKKKNIEKMNLYENKDLVFL